MNTSREFRDRVLEALQAETEKYLSAGEVASRVGFVTGRVAGRPMVKAALEQLAADNEVLTESMSFWRNGGWRSGTGYRHPATVEHAVCDEDPFARTRKERRVAKRVKTELLPVYHCHECNAAVVPALAAPELCPHCTAPLSPSAKVDADNRCEGCGSHVAHWTTRAVSQHAKLADAGRLRSNLPHDHCPF